MKVTMYRCDRCRGPVLPLEQVVHLEAVTGRETDGHAGHDVIDGVDLCFSCAAVMLPPAVQAMPRDQRATWFEAVRETRKGPL